MPFDYQDMSAPFALKGAGKKAALLIHGFLASPYIMRSLGKVLNQAGYAIQAITLPGHGTVYQDLRDGSYSRWQKHVDDAVQSLQAVYDEVVIVGFSLGSILGLIAAFKFKLEKVIALSPAFRVTPAAQILKYLSFLRLDRLIPDLRCTQSEIENFGSYRRFSAHAVAEVQKTIDHYHKALLRQKQLPKLYVACSVDDSTVEIAGVLASIPLYPAGSRFRIYTADRARLPKNLSGDHIKIIDAHNFKRIKAFSHVSLPVAPDDPYFGEQGAYYGNLAEAIFFAEPTWRTRDASLKRLTYNPDFEAMSADMLTWLEGERVKVVIGIITNDQGELCLAKRPGHVHLGGLWEFPGGKLSPDETPLAGLKRELQEEVGIDVLRAEPFMCFPYEYPQLKVELDFWKVTEFEGRIHGKEGQPIRWVKPESLKDYAVPEASLPVIEALVHQNTLHSKEEDKQNGGA